MMRITLRRSFCALVLFLVARGNVACGEKSGAVTDAGGTGGTGAAAGTGGSATGGTSGGSTSTGGTGGTTGGSSGAGTGGASAGGASGTGGSSGQAGGAGTSAALPSDGFSVLVSTTGYSGVNGVAIDPQGNAVVVGYEGGTAVGVMSTGRFATTGNVLVAKVDPAGAILWKQVFTRMGTDAAAQGNDVAVAADGAIWVAGDFAGTLAIGSDTVDSEAPDIAGDTSALVMKLDASGTPVFAKAFPGMYAQSVAVAADGTAYVAGQGGSEDEETGPYDSVFVLALDPSGAVLSRHDFPAGSARWPHLAISTTELALTGTARSSLDFGDGPTTLPTGTDSPFIAIFARGDLTPSFHQAFPPGADRQTPGTLLLDDDGTVTLSGTGETFYVRQLDPTHAERFTTPLGEPNGTAAIARHSSGDFFLTGRGNTPGSFEVHPHLYRVSPEGAKLGAWLFGATGDARAIAADDAGNVYVGGILEDPGDIGFGQLNGRDSALLVRLRY